MPASKLIRPHEDYKDSFLDALAEYHGEGRFSYLNIDALRNDFSGLTEALRADRGRPSRPFPDWVEPVPESILWLVKDGEYLGSAEIRHRLNWHLERWGGHIGFVIRPSSRGKGYGKKILQKAIPFANHAGIDRALLTIAPENRAAIHIVERCGGVFEDETQATGRFPVRRRYWLDCT